MRKIMLAVALLSVGGAIGAVVLAAPASLPSVEDLQGAYDREAVVAGALHDKDVKIVGIDCAADEKSQYFCQVGFKKLDENSDRVYLDAALIERQRSKWKLLSGLCRRLI